MTSCPLTPKVRQIHTHGPPKAKLQAIPGFLTDMQKGIAPSKATLTGSDTFSKQFVASLPFYIPDYKTAAGVTMAGVEGLHALLGDLQARMSGDGAKGEVAADADAKETPAEDNKPKVTLSEVEPLCVLKFWMSSKDTDGTTALVDKVVRSSQTVQLGSFGGARDDKKQIKKQRDADACSDGDECDGGYARGSSSSFD